MPSEADKKLIFMHLPKCGGNSFKSVLRRFYSPKQAFEIRVVKSTGNNLDRLSNMSSEKKEQLRVVLGHTEFGLHSQLPGNWNYVTFLRDPVDRIVSYYYYVKRTPKHRLFLEEKFHDKMSLGEFVNSINEPDIHNGQIRFISGVQASPQVMLEKAQDNLSSHFSYVGTIERFDEGLLLLQSHYGWPVPYYFVKNQTSKRPSEKLVDPDIIDSIKEKNKEDIALYQEVSGREERLLSANTHLLEGKEKLEKNNKRLKVPLRIIDTINDLRF